MGSLPLANFDITENILMVIKAAESISVGLLARAGYLEYHLEVHRSKYLGIEIHNQGLLRDQLYSV